jgi:hypothetical protein
MLIDVFNDSYQHTGTEDKKAAHASGLWHRTFSALAIIPATRHLILQKKAPGRYTFDRPDYADITVGGHYEVRRSPTASAGSTRNSGCLLTTVTCIRSAYARLPLPWPPTTSSASSSTGTCCPSTSAAGHPTRRCRGSWPGGDQHRRRNHPSESSISTVPARYSTRADNGLEYSDATISMAELAPNFLKLDQLYLRLVVSPHRYCAGERQHLFW